MNTGARVIMEPLDALKKYFGFDYFLDGQSEVLEHILTGRDGLVVMPTGGGKSLCYQLPALCLSGVTIVVSPLIALMKDQVDALVDKGIPATLINSSLSYEEQKDRMFRLKKGEYKLVYVAPERFKSQGFMKAMQDVDVALFAVDEAHCLSQWGHDFRPDYMKLGNALEALGKPQCIALTATATPVVREDILKVLRLTKPFEMVSGFSRPNLSLAIVQVEKVHQKFARIKRVVSEHKTGIIYCATRKRVEEVAEHLADQGVSCVAYHGGMSDSEREKTQNVFISKQVDVAVATNAFGMGIDRSDVRFVIHFEIPGSVEAYYQEAGRAGRDGESAVCELLFNYADTRTQEFFIEGVNPTYATIASIYQHIQNHADKDYELHQTLDQIKEGASIKNGMSVGAALGVLMKSGYIERFDLPKSRAKGTRLTQPHVLTSKLKIDRASLEIKDKRDREKLHAMVELAYSKICRQKWILEYFGEPNATICGNCDICIDKDGHTRKDLTNDELIIVRKALSGVARMSRKTSDGWDAIFGKGRIIQMLSGSKSQDIMRCKLDKLSTYGILSNHRSDFLNTLFRGLLEAGLVCIQKKQFPLMTLTPAGEDVMKGVKKSSMNWPSADAHTKRESQSVEIQELGFDTALFQKLKDVRNSLAKKQNVPVYIIFPDPTLELITRLKPHSEDAALKIKGVGKVKAERYLDLFLRVIKNHEMGL
ncbi:ATP-dependent DNA helicase [Akkermansiaceae bacterium]|nr:ATP-dependent DNA helicase [Akkermansiaceae bacterium]